MASDPANAEIRLAAAKAGGRLGNVYALLASTESSPSAKRMEYWREARSWYRRSRAGFLEIRDRGALTEADADRRKWRGRSRSVMWP
jgi:hypothetical protein